MTAKTARIPSPMLNNPAPEIKLAPERDAVMATAPRRKSFPPIITEAAPKAKIHRSPAMITRTQVSATAITAMSREPPRGAAQIARKVSSIIFHTGVPGSFFFSLIRLSRIS